MTTGTDSFVALDDRTPCEGTVFRCALCGLRFTHGGRTCGGCPLGSSCRVVACPGCGYSFPRSSRLVEWLTGLFGRRKGES